jgi:hypothetical protein
VVDPSLTGNGGAGVRKLLDWQETKSPDRAVRSTEPSSHRIAVLRELRAERKAMARDRSPARPTLGDDDPATDDPRCPAPASRDPRGKPQPDVHRGHQVVHVDQLGLQLDHEQGPVVGMPGQGVDDATLSIRRERDLWLDDPSGQGGELDRERLMHRRMTRADDPGEIAAAPPDHEVEVDVEGRGHRTERADRHSTDLATLDSTHDVTRRVRGDADLVLRQLEAQTNGLEPPTDLAIVHIPDIGIRPLSPAQPTRPTMQAPIDGERRYSPEAAGTVSGESQAEGV